MVEGTIYLINAKFKYKKKQYKLLEVVWKYQGNKQYTRMRVLEGMKVKQPVTLYDIEIIKELGHENKGILDYIKAKKSDEQRNNTTGAYE
jgi:hypothetical protein